MIEEAILKQKRTEIQTLVNELNFCWICGREDLLTEHHVVNQKIQGAKMNIKIPICSNCIEVLHANDVISALLKRIFLR